MGWRQIVSRRPGNCSHDGATLKCELLGGIHVGDDNRRLKLDDAGNRDGRLLLRFVIVLVGPVVNFREQVRSGTPTTLERTDLRMVYRDLEGVLSPERRSRGQGVVGGVRASLTRKMDGYGRASSGVLGMIGPGVRGSFLSDFSWFQGDGRIAFAVKPLRSFQADANTPIGLVAKAKKKNGVMRRMRGLRPHRQALLLSLRRGLLWSCLVGGWF